MRPGARLGMPLEAERGSIRAREPLQRPIEQRNVRGPQVARNALRVDGKAMVLAGDHDLPGVEVLYRMVGAVMAEFHLHGLRARGEPHQLVPEANPEYGDARAVEDFANRLDG